MFSFACTQARRNSASSLRQRTRRDQVVDRHLVRAELSDGDRRALRCDRRDDHVDTRAVRQRASTIGDDSSTRRPSGATMRSMMRMMCWSSRKRTELR